MDSLLPSVLCAVEMALLQIAAQVRDAPLSVVAPALRRHTMTTAKAEAPAGEKSLGDESRIDIGHSHVHLNALLTRGQALPASDHEPRGPCSETGAARRRAQACRGVVKVKVGGACPLAEQAARVR